MKQGLKFVVIVSIMFIQQIALAEIPSQVAAFIQATQDPTKVANCANCDFRGTQDLKGLDAHGANLPGINLQACTPSDVNKETIMLCIPEQVANLTGINLVNGTLFSSCADGAIFDNSDLSHLDFSHSSAQYASFKGAKVAGMITENSTFCHAIMPDGTICKDTWSGQGITIACNCSSQDAAGEAAQAAEKAPKAKTTKK